LRNFKDPAAYGAKLRTLEIDGFTRYWYEYVPERVKTGSKPVPLVVNMHAAAEAQKVLWIFPV